MDARTRLFLVSLSLTAALALAGCDDGSSSSTYRPFRVHVPRDDTGQSDTDVQPEVPQEAADESDGGSDEQIGVVNPGGDAGDAGSGEDARTGGDAGASGGASGGAGSGGSDDDGTSGSGDAGGSGGSDDEAGADGDDGASGGSSGGADDAGGSDGAGSDEGASGSDETGAGDGSGSGGSDDDAASGGDDNAAGGGAGDSSGDDAGDEGGSGDDDSESGADEDGAGEGETAAACSVDYTFESAWEDGHQVRVSVTNRRDEALQGWTLAWTLNPGEQVVDVWEVGRYHVDAGRLWVEADSSHWNGTLGAMETREFRLQIARPHGAPLSMPYDFELNGQPCAPEYDHDPAQVPPGVLVCESEGADAPWHDGFAYDFRVTNTGDSPLHTWTVELRFAEPVTVEESWNVRLDAREGDTLRGAPMGYNEILEPGQSAHFGLRGRPGAALPACITP